MEYLIGWSATLTTASSTSISRTLLSGGWILIRDCAHIKLLCRCGREGVAVRSEHRGRGGDSLAGVEVLVDEKIDALLLRVPLHGFIPELETTSPSGRAS